MNRLWVRLTLAFIAVTLVGVATVAVLTDWSAGREFRQYLARQEALTETGLTDELQVFYRQNGNWNGVDQVFSNFGGGGGRGRGQMRGRPFLLLADNAGNIVYDERGTRVGTALSSDERTGALALTGAGGTTAGYLVSTAGAGRGAMQPAEQDFLDELRRTLLIAAVAAGTLGILMGLAISWTVAAPLANLAQAARAFRARRWDRRVAVRGADEIAEVAREFNEMADAIQSAETLRRNLMADVAHELRTPLTVLQGNLRAILDGVYPLEPGEIATLYDETRLLSRLVDDLRELALADAGQLPLSLQDLDLAQVLAGAVANFSAAAGAQDTQLRLEVNGPLPVHADPDRLAQVLRNLMANALRHTPANGVITVSAQPFASGLVRVVVADTGEGIAAEDLPHIFDRFYRGDLARARASGGAGLGLAIAKAWVQAMGGEIGAESRPGSGSRFWFTLPARSIEDLGANQSRVPTAVSESRQRA